MREMFQQLNDVMDGSSRQNMDRCQTTAADAAGAAADAAADADADCVLSVCHVAVRATWQCVPRGSM